MKHFVWAWILIVTSLYGTTLEEIIHTSLDKSPSLDSINAKLLANKQAIELADNFSNPELLVTTNTLDSTQPMSQSVVTLKQKLPFYGKRDANEKIAFAEDEVLNERLQGARVALVAKIKTEAYRIWELEESCKIIDEYIELTKHNIELYENYASVNAGQHIGIMKAELSLSNLQIQKSALEAKIYGAYARLSYLASFEVKELDLALKMGSKPDLKDFQKSILKNPQLLLKEQEVKKEYAKVTAALLSSYPDITLLAGYAYRENFDNFFNLGIGLSLPIYGNEAAQEEQAKALALSKESEKEDMKISVNSTLKFYYAQMNSAYEIYHIIEDGALPQIKHMFELSNASISIGTDLFKYTDVLFQKFSLEQKSVTAIANYNRAQAMIEQLLGETK